MYDFKSIVKVPGWTFEAKTGLLVVLEYMAKEIIQGQLHSKNAELNKTKVKTSNIKNKIGQLKTQLMVLDYKHWENIGLQMDQDFDWEEVAKKLGNRHPTSEYKATWEKFFNPCINKEPWSQEEHQELQCLAAEKKMPDWAFIAETLKTGRSAYQCFLYYRTHINPAVCGNKWTLEEMDYLQKVVNLYKRGSYIPWGKVAGFIKNRTKVQCYNKYSRMIEARKGRFIPEEDTVILNFVNVYGTDFRKMSTFLSGRSAVQLRVRHNILVKNRLSATWSVEDDKKLLQVMANHDKTDNRANFSNATSHFPGKTRQNIRSRYNTLKKWIEKHPEIDIELAPRCGPRRLPHGEPTSNLTKAVHALQAKMNEQLKKSLKDKECEEQSKEASDTLIDDSEKCKKLPKESSDISKISTADKIKKKRQRRRGGDSDKEQKAKDTLQMLQVKGLSDLLPGDPFEMPKFDNTRAKKTYSKKKVTTIKQKYNAILSTRRFKK